MLPAVKTTAIVAAVLLALLGAFQLALAAGAPWGRAAYGGTRPGVLPPGLRITSLVFGALVYPAAILFVLDAGGVLSLSWLPGPRTVIMWILVGFFALGTAANLSSRSPIERLWGPVTAAIAACCAIIALA
jgi:hypothetical protein